MPRRLFSSTERRTLGTLDLEWPDSRGLLDRLAARLATQLPDADCATAQLATAARAGLSAYREAQRTGADDYARFSAFVDGLAEALEPQYRPWLAQSLSQQQRRWLARSVSSPGSD
ncbi:MAG: hypothetical protein EA400_01160 [Chromatiaceae bacterium]|nr:MAG: hypothetical protein EA400_01160 [Chromatiaceae bacterium]